MVKKKSAEKVTRKPAKKAAAAHGASANGEVKKSRRQPTKLTHERLRKLAKKNRPPADYFIGDMEKPW